MDTDLTCCLTICENPLYSKGLCKYHYAKFRNSNRLGSQPCRVTECGNPHYAKGFCQSHYYSWSAHQDPTRRIRAVRGTGSLNKRNGYKVITVDGKQTLEHRHVMEVKLGRPLASNETVTHINGNKADNRPENLAIRLVGGKRLDHEGYVLMSIKGQPVREHRHVMEQHLGRRLRAEESVHHKNGNRADNRLDNLELWSRYQPSGQRVLDKVKWAREIISLYGHLDDG